MQVRRNSNTKVILACYIVVVLIERLYAQYWCRCGFYSIPFLMLCLAAVMRRLIRKAAIKNDCSKIDQPRVDALRKHCHTAGPKTDACIICPISPPTSLVISHLSRFCEFVYIVFWTFDRDLPTEITSIFFQQLPCDKLFTARTILSTY